MKRLPWYISGALVAGTFLLLVVLERRRPLRRSVEPGIRRVVRNGTLAAISASVAAVAHAPIARALTRRVEEQGWGIVPRLHLPAVWAAGVAVLLTDYSYYLWHVALHRVPLLWRIHVVHHCDLDLDTSTALRFHLAEVVVTIPLTAAQIVVIGLNPFLFSVWQVWFALCVMFHHSGVRLPVRFERFISQLIMTPRLHGIHHSIVPEETNSNWSSGLAVWDSLHRTRRDDVAQRAIVIGVPAYRTPREVSLGAVLAMPFVQQPDAFRFPEGGRPLRESEALR